MNAESALIKLCSDEKMTMSKGMDGNCLKPELTSRVQRSGLKDVRESPGFVARFKTSGPAGKMCYHGMFMKLSGTASRT